MAPEIRARSFNRANDRPSQVTNLLSPKEQDALREISTVIEYRRCGHPIFSEREDAHFAYAIDQGVVQIVRHAENGRRQILAFMTPGDLFGLPDDGAYANTAETVSAVRLYRFPWQKLIQRMMEEPQLQLNLLVRIAYDLHQAQGQIMILGSKIQLSDWLLCCSTSCAIPNSTTSATATCTCQSTASILQTISGLRARRRGVQSQNLNATGWCDASTSRRSRSWTLPVCAPCNRLGEVAYVPLPSPVH